MNNNYQSESVKVFCLTDAADPKTDLFKCIDSSNEIAFGWSSKTDLIKHTSILVIFDNMERYFIDFSRNEKSIFDWLFSKFAYSSAICQLLTRRKLCCCCFLSKVKVSIKIKKCQDMSKIESYPTILKFPITELDGKNKAKELVQRLKKINMEEYNANNNNCRTFVRKAVEELKKEKECSPEGLETFHEKMNDIEQTDKIKSSFLTIFFFSCICIILFILLVLILFVPFENLRGIAQSPQCNNTRTQEQ